MGICFSFDRKWIPSSILNHDASAKNSLVIGAPLGMYIGLSLLSSVLTESSNSLEFVIPQAQKFLAYPSTELYIPDNYVSFSKSLGILKWDFQFLDFMRIDSALSRSFNVTSSKNMIRIDYQSGSMILNNIYLVLVIPIVIITHIIIIIISLSKWVNKNVKCTMILGSIKKAMAYTLYTKFLVYSSLFFFIKSFWDIISMDMSKVANVISIIVAVAYIGMMVIYLIKVIRLPEDITETYTNSKQSFLNYIAISLFIGLKTNKSSRLYYLIVIVHKAIIALLIMILKNGLIQLILILILEIILAIYLCIVRPFQFNLNNILVIWNQIVIIISWFILIPTIKIADYTQQGFNGTIGIILIAIASVNLVVLVAQSSVLSLIAIIKKLNIRFKSKIFVKERKRIQYTTRIERKNEDENLIEDLKLEKSSSHKKLEETLSFDQVEEVKLPINKFYDSNHLDQTEDKISNQQENIQLRIQENIQESILEN